MASKLHRQPLREVLQSTCSPRFLQVRWNTWNAGWAYTSPLVRQDSICWEMRPGSRSRLGFQLGYASTWVPSCLTSTLWGNVPLSAICGRKDSVKLLVGHVALFDHRRRGMERLSEVRWVPRSRDAIFASVILFSVRCTRLSKGVTLDFSRPGKPTDNTYIEAFNGRFRAECLNAYWFLTLADAPEKLDECRRYTTTRDAHRGDWAQGRDLAAQSRWRRRSAIVRKPGNPPYGGPENGIRAERLRLVL